MKDTKLNAPEFNKLVVNFEDELQKENCPEDHIAMMTSYVKEFLNYVEENGIQMAKEIDQRLVNGYIKFLEEQRINNRYGGMLKQTTIHRHIGAIRKFWKYLNVEEVKVNAIRIKQKKATDKKETTVLTLKEIEQLYSVCDESAIGYRDKAMFAVYFGMGLRKGEGLRLLLTDLDFGRGRAFIRKTKNNRERYVIMSPTVQKQIEEYVYSYRDYYLREGSTHQELFIGERGNPICPETVVKRLEALWNRVKERYGSDKEITCHGLRHACGTFLYMAGMELENVALMLGHRTLEATQIYIHLSKKLSNEQI